MSEADRQALYEQEAQRFHSAASARWPTSRCAYVYCMEQAFGTGTVLTVEGGTLLV